MDLKLADKDKAKYQSVPFWLKYQVTVTGYKILNEQKEILEKRHKIYLYTRIDDIFDIFIRFFKTPTNTKQDILQYIKEMIDQIDDIRSIVSENKYSLS